MNGKSEATKKKRKLPNFLEDAMKKAKPILGEVNFLKYPMFWLDHRRKLSNQPASIIYKDGEKVWEVIPSAKYGLPTQFDRQVQRAIEQVISEQDLPLRNPLILPSLRELCRKMDIKEANASAVKESIKRMVATTIEVSGTFRFKQNPESKPIFIEKSVNLYQDVTFIGEKDPKNGNVESRMNILTLSEWYLTNINSYFFRILDYTFWQELENPTTQRLYEHLGAAFYGVIQGGNDRPYKLIYAEFAALAPLTAYDAPSRRKAQLSKAIETLITKGYIAKSIPDSKWSVILLFPGPRFFAEVQYLKAKWETRGIAHLPGLDDELEEQPPMSIQSTLLFEEMKAEEIDIVQEVVRAYYRLFQSGEKRTSADRREREAAETIIADAALETAQEVQDFMEFAKREAERTEYKPFAIQGICKYAVAYGSQLAIERESKRQNKLDELREQLWAPYRKEYQNWLKSELERRFDALSEEKRQVYISKAEGRSKTSIGFLIGTTRGKFKNIEEALEKEPEHWLLKEYLAYQENPRAYYVKAFADDIERMLPEFEEWTVTQGIKLPQPTL